MALGEGGLDAQVEQRMDAYRGNPQQLQQNYGKNKELLDLLALQKLNKEKKDTAAAMAMEAQQQPGTIAQQREAEALELIKGEMGGTLGELTGRTAETLNQKARSQKQGMNKLMKRAAKPPAGIAGLMGAQPPQRRSPMGNPQAQGLANARMAQAAAQPGGPVRMAQGGIVGFKTGKGVEASGNYDFSGIEKNNDLGNAITKELGIRRSLDLFKRIERSIREDGTVSTAVIDPRTQELLAELTGARRTITPTDEIRFAKGLTDGPDDAELMGTLGEEIPPVVAIPEVAPEVASEVNPLANTSDPKKSTITYPSTYQNPQDILSAVNPGYDPQGVTMPSTSDMTQTQALLAEAGSKTPPASLLQVDDPTLAPLVPTDGTGLTQEGENIKAALIDRDRQNANKDPIQIQKDAQTASDIYTARERNRKDYLASAEAERELQSRTMSPAQLASEARIATFSGGRKGRGGMSQAYLEAMKNQRADLSGGLSNLRDIQQNRITRDMDAATIGSARGGEAAIGARDAVARGESGLRGEVAAQRATALQGQKLQTDLNVAVYKHDSAIAKSTFEEAGKVIARNFSRLTSQLDNDETRYNAQVKRAIADTGAVNDALAARVEQTLANAKERAELAFKSGKLAQEGVNAAKELLRKYELEATKLMNDKLAKDLGFMELNSMLSQMSEAENPDEFAQLQARVEGIYQSHLAQQILIAPDIFGEQEALKDYIARLEAGAPSSQSTIGRESVTNFSEDLDKSGSPGYR